MFVLLASRECGASHVWSSRTHVTSQIQECDRPEANIHLCFRSLDLLVTYWNSSMTSPVQGGCRTCKTCNPPTVIHPTTRTHMMSIVITVSRSTWMTTKQVESPPIFLYGCDRSPGMHVFKLRTEIPNLKQNDWFRDFKFGSTITRKERLAPSRRPFENGTNWTRVVIQILMSMLSFTYLNHMDAHNFITYFGIIRPTILFRKKQT